MSRLVMTSYKNRLVNSQKPSSLMQRPGKQLAIQQLAAAIHQQKYQQYMRKTDFILQHIDPIVENNYNYDFNYEEPKFIQEEPEFIQEEPKFIQEEPKFIQEEPKFIQEEPKFIQEEPDNNITEIQQTTLPINISIKNNNNKKKKFNTDKINTIIETDKQDPFKLSRKSMIEKAISTLITKFMFSRQ